MGWHKKRRNRQTGRALNRIPFGPRGPPRLTQVDFYQIESSEDPLLFTCRLIEKVYRLGHQVHVHASSETQATALDDLLWGFKAAAFIPHERAKPNARAPILICHEAVPEQHHDVLINLNSGIPEFFSRFNRVAEIVPKDDEKRAAARERFRFYKTRGYPLQYHKMAGR